MTKASLIFLMTATILLGMFFFDHWQRLKIFEPAHQLYPTPDEMGVPYKDIWLTIRNMENEDKGILHGWWLPNKEASMLYLHGSESTIATDLDKILQIWNAGYSVLAIDYRGFGQSTKMLPNENSVTEDAMAAWDYLKTLSDSKNFHGIYGHSLGSAIAINIGKRHPEVDYLVLEGSFSSMADIIKETTPYRWLPSLLLTQKFESMKNIQGIAIPKLFIHCRSDEIVPFFLGEKLYQAAGLPKTRLILEKGGHQTCSHADAALWKNAMRMIMSKNSST
ncbi:alpha/beta hydrolase [Chromobacterium violaceum]|uniref:Serine aminopeptidase S33 domain-containing protein n=1 Tax=Chromobacterium violaceum (strain ATCC 12472 / DSM 30191 / JCM 1249 / CCUG 213 / NBRC 12614 / NCIMB 9131 / NCTC 9757 / MK) TaxID=243365 RepID=Q7NWW4_CHRVO|nr:alpha/beta hydrolase [Chromobacterium violaceum]AAQ59539.1 conserved hypothetical protein [Chromobacterium violaceum ATCC 12472]SUX83826.1 acetoin dehydrogenase E2 subunit dihydrolipoyllysine-residue acetyltransferase [Chromobacterium violaceum]